MEHILVSIHGIARMKSDTHWQERLSQWVPDHTKQIKYVPYRYGFWLGLIPYIASFKIIGVLAYWFSKGFCNKLRKIKERNPHAKIHILAHSFGSWILQSTLLQLNFNVESVHIVGGVISAHIENNLLDEFLNSGIIKRVYIWSSKDDEIVRFSPPPFGHIGYWGIIDKDIPTDRIRPRRQPYPDLQLFNYPVEFDKNKVGSHSEYFEPSFFNRLLSDVLGID